MFADYTAINIKNISDVKRSRTKASAVEAYKRDIKQHTLLKKLKHKSLALEVSLLDNTDLILVSNLNIY